MTPEDLVKKLRFRFSAGVVDPAVKSPRRIFAAVTPDNVPQVSEYLCCGLGARFITATGMELPAQIEIIYHFAADDVNAIMSLRTKIDATAPVIESITPVVEAANWAEREMSEMLGIEFRGHPDMRPLLLPEDWPEETFPMRQDYRECDQDAI